MKVVMHRIRVDAAATVGSVSRVTLVNILIGRVRRYGLWMNNARMTSSNDAM